MGIYKVLMKTVVLFLVVSTSFAGGRGHSKIENKMGEETNNSEEISSGAETVMNTIHERLLKVNTKDYGNYKPAPALVRPPFKLIPN